MTEQLVRYQAPMEEIERAASAMHKSKFFADSVDVNQAIVKVMAGAEIGIGAFASMTGIHIIKGKPTYGANILAAKVKGSGKYDYRVKEISEKACEIEFLQSGASLGVSRFTIEDARKAGTQNTDKFPRNMLFARAMSNGIKWFTPDVLGGVTAYVPEEFGAVVDDNNMIVDATPEPVKQPAPDPFDKAFPASEGYVTNARDLSILDVDRKGAVTPALLVELKLSENEFSAKNALHALKFTSKTPAAEALPIVRKYRANRDAGMTTEDAAEDALAPF
jgi:hypothetical protein